ncbi:MAG: FtsX-like permease family protein [Candidatus Aminicenantes bacterium]|nr:FtsX-like permease family protein [Candidatus Aminicenantes bacterium]
MDKPKHNLKVLEFLLRNLVSVDDRENLAGDFEEMYDRIYHQKGKARAVFWYFFQVIILFPVCMKNDLYWSLTMIKNYLKTAFRNIKKFKSYSFINIFGMAMGMACCILIVLFVQDELSFDRYHDKADRIVRLVDGFDVKGGLSRYYALSSAPFAPRLKKEFPEVEETVRIFPGRGRMVEYEEKKFYEDYLFFADASLFKVFTFPLIKGDPETALISPHTIVVSEKIARKYFGSKDPLNKILTINNQDYLVTGVMKEVPENSHFFANLFASLKTLEQIPSIKKRYFQSWARHEFYTYLLLQESTSVEKLEAKLPGFIERHAAAQIKSILGGKLYSRLQPLTSIHLHSHLQAELEPNGDIKYVTIFSVIALFVLLIACVNFINLATARSFNRSKEVGLRKVVGATRYQIVKQFLSESLLFTVMALGLSLVLVIAAFPFFNSLTGKEIGLNLFNRFFLMGSLFLILVFVGVLSASYPAFFISRYQPAQVLRQHKKTGSQSSFLRKSLVVFQFSISIVLIISTVVVLNQLDFLRNRKLGFDKEHVVVIPIRSHNIRSNAEAIKSELMQNPNVLSSTVTIGVPGGVVAGDAIQLVTEDGKKTLSLDMIYTDHDYIKTMGMEIIEGRDFSKQMSTDATQAFIINEAAVRKLELEEPLETRFEWGDKRGKVIGVVKDFQFQSLRNEINPLVIHVWLQNTFVFAVRVRPDNIPQTLEFLKTKWKELDPAHPFDYSFMDETFDQIYKGEEKLGQVFSSFSFLAIFIACLGLFGLSIFMVETRTKEIGIRKILGASAGNIMLLLSKKFTLLVLTANLIAWPAAYVVMRKWLQSFAYRIPMEPWIFVLSGFIALIVALWTISFQAVKAAFTDPVKTLRYE